MKERTLVLNLDYTPISVCTAQRAFLLVFLQKAELVRENDQKHIRTVDRQFPMPSVIKLRKYIPVPYKKVVLSKDNIFRRDQYTCQYCGTDKELTLDHLVPKARGGATTWNNLVTACKRCNSTKGNCSPEEAGMQLRVKPFRPSYIIFIRDFSGFSNEEWLPFLDSSGKVA